MRIDDDQPDPKDAPEPGAKTKKSKAAKKPPYKDSEGFTTPPDGKCRCRLRWPQVLELKVENGVARPLRENEDLTCESIFFVPWFPTNGPWPFGYRRSRKLIYQFPFTLGEYGEKPLLLYAHIGIARCECGNIIIYGENITTSWGATFSQVAAALPQGAGKMMKEVMWARTLDILPDVRENALALSWPYFPPQHA